MITRVVGAAGVLDFFSIFHSGLKFAPKGGGRPLRTNILAAASAARGQDKIVENIP